MEQQTFGKKKGGILQLFYALCWLRLVGGVLSCLLRLLQFFFLIATPTGIFMMFPPLFSFYYCLLQWKLIVTLERRPQHQQPRQQQPSFFAENSHAILSFSVFGMVHAQSVSVKPRTNRNRRPGSRKRLARAPVLSMLSGSPNRGVITAQVLDGSLHMGHALLFGLFAVARRDRLQNALVRHDRMGRVSLKLKAVLAQNLKVVVHQSHQRDQQIVVGDGGDPGVEPCVQFRHGHIILFVNAFHKGLVNGAQLVDVTADGVFPARLAASGSSAMRTNR